MYLYNFILRIITYDCLSGSLHLSSCVLILLHVPCIFGLKERFAFLLPKRRQRRRVAPFLFRVVIVLALVFPPMMMTTTITTTQKEDSGNERCIFCLVFLAHPLLDCRELLPTGPPHGRSNDDTSTFDYLGTEHARCLLYEGQYAPGNNTDGPPHMMLGVVVVALEDNRRSSSCAIPARPAHMIVAAALLVRALTGGCTLECPPVPATRGVGRGNLYYCSHICGVCVRGWMDGLLAKQMVRTYHTLGQVVFCCGTKHIQMAPVIIIIIVLFLWCLGGRGGCGIRRRTGSSILLLLLINITILVYS